jgi:hypothetical protein
VGGGPGVGGESSVAALLTGRTECLRIVSAVRCIVGVVCVEGGGNDKFRLDIEQNSKKRRN